MTASVSLGPKSNFGFDGPVRAVIIGGRGGIGEALVDLILDGHAENQITVTSRDLDWVSRTPRSDRVRRLALDLTDDASFPAFADEVEKSLRTPNMVINCSGLLHDGALQPERTWRHLDREAMLRSFDVHVCGLALLVRHLIPMMPRKGRSVFASLSARVGN